jgi:hypothetical protein
VQLSVTTPTALASQDTGGYLAGVLAYVQNLKRSYSLDPTSVAVPDGDAVISAMGGGNWVALPGVGVIGSTSIGTSIFYEEGTDWAGIGAGATATVFQVPAPTLGTGEQVTIAAAVDLQANVAARVVSGATNASPIVVTLDSTAGLATGDRISILGVAGNTAANGGFWYSVAGSTISLFNDPGLTSPVAGNGAYTSGGVAVSYGFGHFERRATFRSCAGAIVNAQGGTTDTDLTTPPAPGNLTASLIGASCVIAVVAGAIVVKVTAPTNTPLRASVSLSYVRRPMPGAGAAPTVTSSSLSSGPGLGGTTVVLTGSGFTGAVNVTFAGVPAASFVVDNPTQITAVTAADPGGLGDVGDIVVVTPNGIGAIGSPTAWSYTSSPATIFSDLRGWYPNSAIQHSGGAVTTWTDQSTHAQNATVGGGAPAFVTSSTHITPNGPAVLLNGTSDFLSKTGFALASSGNPNLFFWAVARPTNSFGGLISCAGSELSYGLNGAAAGKPTGINGQGVLLWTGTASMLNTLEAATYYAPGSGSSATAEVSVANAAPNTTTGNVISVTPTSGTLRIGQSENSLTFGAGEIYEIGVASVPGGMPSSAQLAALEAYFQRTYGVP